MLFLLPICLISVFVVWIISFFLVILIKLRFVINRRLCSIRSSSLNPSCHHHHLHNHRAPHSAVQLPRHQCVCLGRPGSTHQYKCQRKYWAPANHFENTHSFSCATFLYPVIYFSSFALFHCYFLSPYASPLLFPFRSLCYRPILS